MSGKRLPLLVLLGALAALGGSIGWAVAKSDDFDSKGNGATEVLVDPPTGFVSLEYGPAMMWNTRYGLMSGRYGSGMMAGMMGRYGGEYGAGMMGGGVMGGGMMGQGYGRGSSLATPPSTKPAVSAVEAHALAQRWLDANESGTKVEAGGDAFPGYYTLETLRDGRINGMLSVNAYTGTVWPHWWHGRFVAKTE